MSNEYCPECSAFIGSGDFQHCPNCGASFNDDWDDEESDDGDDE